MRRLVDAVAIPLLLATLLGLADSEILLLCGWVVLGIGAFVYGLRVAVLRILISAAVAVAVAMVAVAVDRPLDFLPIENGGLTEWPMLVVIALIVAVLADRIATSAGRYAALYRQASERLLTAHEEERARLARDLHDGVGQTLTAVVLTLDAAEAELGAGSDSSSSTARSTILRAQTLAVAALAEARDVAAQLRPTRIQEIGLGAALRNLAGSAGVDVDARFDPALLPPGVLEADRVIDAYRIVQEAIGNAARHSRAKSIWLDGRVLNGRIELEVGDDGVGFDPSAWSRGLGLAGMQERTAILKGRLDIRSQPGEGTVVRLSIPTSGGLGRRRNASVPAAGPVG